MSIRYLASVLTGYFENIFLGKPLKRKYYLDREIISSDPPPTISTVIEHLDREGFKNQIKYFRGIFREGGGGGVPPIHENN